MKRDSKQFKSPRARHGYLYLGWAKSEEKTYAKIFLKEASHRNTAQYKLAAPGSGIVGSAELRKREHEKKNAQPTFLVPFTFAYSPLSESLGQKINQSISFI